MPSRVRIFSGALAAHAEGVVNERVDEAMEAGVESARRLVPIDTGELHDGIDIIEPASGGRGSYGVTGVEHALHVEFGTQNGPTQPYLRPSMDAMKRGSR